jgi:hypothetical protein
MIVLPKAIALKHGFIAQGCLWMWLCYSKEIFFGKWLCCHVECWATFHFVVNLFLGEFGLHLKIRQPFKLCIKLQELFFLVKLHNG